MERSSLPCHVRPLVHGSLKSKVSTTDIRLSATNSSEQIHHILERDNNSHNIIAPQNRHRLSFY